MIINIRGTSGSGKSTLVRKIMDRYKVKNPYHISGRKQPIGYVLSEPKDGTSKSLAIVGHYETACGGCDTIGSMDQIFGLVKESHAAGYNVIFEGLLISADHKRNLELHTLGLPLVVISLQKIDLETCLASVNERRMARLGPEKFTPVKEKNTASKHKGVIKSSANLERDGVRVIRCDRDEAEAAICRELSIK